MKESRSVALGDGSAARFGPGAISRRHVLFGGAAAASWVLIADGTAPGRAQAAIQNELTAEAWTTSASVFDTAFSASVPTVSLLGFTARGAKNSLSSAQIDVSYDTRSQTWSGGNATLVAGGAIHDLAVTGAVDGANGSVTFTLPQTSAEVVDVGLPLTNVLLYPMENVGPLAAPVILITPVADSVPIAVEAVSQQVSSTGTAWGAEVDVAWGRMSEIAGGSGSAYAYPSAVRLRSTGPGPIPVGTTVNVLADANLIEALALGDSPDGENSGVRVLTSGGGEMVLEVSQPLGEGIDTNLSIIATVASNPRIDDAITYGRVWVTSTPETKPMQRQTRRESAIAASDSGTPLVVGATRGRI